MNQGVMAAIAGAFLLPIALVVAWNFGEWSGPRDPDARPAGTLLYFYADW